jgi:HPt (histidine-containing phosphotransfer) domain-containing protein
VKTRSRKPPVVKTFSDHSVLVPENALKDAIAIATNPGAEADLIAKAETALEQLSNSFPAWMQDECERLGRLRRAAHKDGLAGAARDELFRAAHDLRGHAATFGYPFAAEAADSLCRLLEHAPEPGQIPLSLVDQHVDGIRAIVRETVNAATKATAKSLCDKLREVTDAFLVERNAHRPGYLDGIIAPPLAPAE